MISFAESVRMFRASTARHFPDCRELATTPLACVFRLLATLIQNMIPFAEAIRMIRARTRS